MGYFYDFDWGTEGEKNARATERLFLDKAERISGTVGVVMLASVITSRGLAVSPSKPLEAVIRSKTTVSNDELLDALYASHEILFEGINEVVDHINHLNNLVTSQHRIGNKCSATLVYSAQLTHEKIMQMVAITIDFVSGWRGVMAHNLGIPTPVTFTDFLAAGINRSILLNTYGPDFKDSRNSTEE